MRIINHSFLTTDFGGALAPPKSVVKKVMHIEK